MVREKTTKIIALTLATVIVALSFVSPDYDIIGIKSGASLRTRFAYPFFHANILHCLFNAWSVLAIAFIFRPAPFMLILSYVIAISIPSCVLTDVPTIGLSGVVFSLFGYLTTIVKYRKTWLAVMVAQLAFGFIVPSINGWVHVYCFFCGLLLGLINMPVPCRRN